MALDPVTALLDLGGKVFDRIFPDPAQAAAAKLEMYKMQQSGELVQITGQLEINKVEAASSSAFVAGARPFILWVCGFAFAYAAILEPIARFVATVVYQYSGAFPVIDTMLTLQVLGGLLGLGTLRSWDKKNGVAS